MSSPMSTRMMLIEALSAAEFLDGNDRWNVLREWDQLFAILKGEESHRASENALIAGAAEEQVRQMRISLATLLASLRETLDRQPPETEERQSYSDGFKMGLGGFGETSSPKGLVSG